MEHCARNSLLRALLRQASFWAASVIVGLASAGARAQQNLPLPPLAQKLSAMGVPILPNQSPPGSGGAVPQNSNLGNSSDPFHVFDPSGQSVDGSAKVNTPAAAPVPSTASAKVLVLKSGRVLQGTIRSDSRGYFVDAPRSSLYFPFPYVQFIATDLQDAHAKMCDSVGGSSVHREGLLGRWCLENDLRPEAADHFKKVLAIEPGNHEARHALAQLERSQSDESADEPPVKSRSAQGDSQLTDSLSRLSGSAVREFVIGIQPILLSRCGGVKCHSGGSSPTLGPGSFHLEHVRLSQGSNRAATARNLDAVLNLIDSQFPSQSVLFQKGLQPHGGLVMRAPLEGAAGRAQEMRLRRWIDAISPERNRLRRDQASRAFVNRFAQSRKPPTLRDPNVVPASANAEGENDAEPANSLTPPSGAPPAFGSPISAPKQFGPLTDPFDPARFNSR
jgi:hypothetical protein